MDMDEGWMWWPVTKFETDEELMAHLEQLGDQQDLIDFVRKRETPSMEIPSSLIAEYEEVRAKYRSVMERFEQLYRIQEGMKPHADTPIPVYNLLRKE
jgi:hypothetical protein